MLANLNNANNLGLRFLATNESECIPQFCVIILHSSHKRNKKKKDIAAKIKSFLVIGSKHIIDKAINNI